MSNDAGASVRLGVEDEDDSRRDSSHIVSWNTPQDLPQNTPTGMSRRTSRAVSAGHGSRTESRHVSNSNPSSRKESQVAIIVNETTIESHSVSPLCPSNESGVRDGATPAQNAQDDPSRAQQMFESKKEARRLRQSLKETGDFLGVQGVNPETGEMDVLTPTTSSGSTAPLNHSPRLGGFAQMVQETKEAYREAKWQHETELRRAQSKREQDRLNKIEKEKEAIRTEQSQIRWRKEAGQWSSVAEPNLSPIAQSQRSGTPSSEKPKASPQRHSQATVQLEVVSEQPQALPTDRAPTLIMSPEDIAHGSSETIIHTPSRHQSSFLGSSGTEIHHHDFRNSSFPDKENQKEARAGCLKTNQRPQRRLQDLRSPLPDPRDEQSFVTDTNSPEGTPRDSSIIMGAANESFLWDRQSIPTEPGRTAEQVTSASPLWMETMEAAQDRRIRREDEKLDGPNLQIRQFAMPDSREVEVENLAKRGTGRTPAGFNAKQCHDEDLNPPGPSQDKTSPVVVQPARPQPILFRKPPKIPKRLGPSQGDTSPLRQPPEKLIDLGLKTPQPMSRSTLQENRARMPGSCLLDDPAEEWTGALIQDIAKVSRQPKERAQFAFIPTTTTTGSDHNLPSHDFGGVDGALDARGGPVIQTLTDMTEAFGLPDPNIGTGLPPFPPKMAQSTLWSADRPPGILTTGTSSARQLTSTKLRTERLSPKASSRPAALTVNQTGPTKRIISPMSNATSHQSDDFRAVPVTASPHERPRAEAMALGAAQMALDRANSTSDTRMGATPTNKQPLVGLSNGQDVNGGTGDNFRIARAGDPLHMAGFSASRLARQAVYALLGAVWAYWVFIGPVFNSRSSVRRRFDAGRSTWADVVLFVLAAAFLLGVLVAAIWAFRGLLFVMGIFEMAAEGFTLLIGL